MTLSPDSDPVATHFSTCLQKPLEVRTSIVIVHDCSAVDEGKDYSGKKTKLDSIEKEAVNNF